MRSEEDVGHSIAYIYDPVGNITEIINGSNNDAAGTATLEYGDLYRLTSVTVTGTPAGIEGYTQTLEYDALGNITNKSDVGDFAYAGTGYANPDAVTDIAGTTVTYDNNGNVMSLGNTSFTWDHLNRLTQVGNGTTTSTYGYDSSGQRVYATVTTATTTQTTYYPSKHYNVTSDNVVTKHVFANDEEVATIAGSGAGATPGYIHTDHLGGTNVVTDDTGTIVQLLDYYPYGSQRIDEESGYDAQRQFIGQFYDPASQLSYLNARFYAGARGKFLSQDPVFWDNPNAQDLANPQSLNSYSYANGNPITSKDPEGKSAAAASGILPATGLVAISAPVAIGGLIVVGGSILLTVGVAAAIDQYREYMEQPDNWRSYLGQQQAELGQRGGNPFPNPNDPDWRKLGRAIMEIGGTIGGGTYLTYQAIKNDWLRVFGTTEPATGINNGQLYCPIPLSPAPPPPPSPLPPPPMFSSSPFSNGTSTQGRPETNVGTNASFPPPPPPPPPRFGR